MTDMRTIFDKTTADWFAAALGEPTQVQKEAWPAIAGGKQSTIIFQMIMTAVFRPSMFSNLFRDSGRILFQNGSYIFEGIMIRQSLFDVDSVRESHMFLCMN